MIRDIYQYKGLDRWKPVEQYIAGLDGKSRGKILEGINQLRNGEFGLELPYVKEFVQTYKGLYELRPAMVKPVRVLFRLSDEGHIILLHAYLKKNVQSTKTGLEWAKEIIWEMKNKSARLDEFRLDLFREQV